MKPKVEVELVGSSKDEKNVTLELENFIESSSSSVERPKTTLTWHNLEVYLPSIEKKIFSKVKTEKKHIIKNISGIAKPTEILAILGSSGAGKTTLLNTLNFRQIDSLNIKGDIKINGKSLSSIEQLTSISGYVQQQDLFVDTLKVKEHLFFQAILRMDKNTSKKERENRIKTVLNDLNLTKCKDSLIGNPERGVKGISGGEMRRLSFASEIITDPSILFCDEPTSGLDSFMAMSIVESMKSLAKSGKTIICTIHQPSSEVFEKFDKICFLSEGKLAYIGDQSMASDFFDRIGYKCPANYNPADYYIKILSIKPTDRENCLQAVENITNEFKKSLNFKMLNSQMSFIDSQTGLEKYYDEPTAKSIVYRASILTQMRWLFWQHGLAILRDSQSLINLVLQAIIVGILFGVIFYQTNLDQEGIQNINASLFLCIIYFSVTHLFAVINTFPLELQVFRKDHQNGMYSVFSYYVTKSIAELPIHVLMPLIFTTIFYWMADLNNSMSSFIFCCIIQILVANSALSLGHFVSAVSPNVSVATTLAGPILGVLMIFSGSFVNNASVPKYFLWIKYLSWLNYSGQALMVNQWANVTNIECEGYARCFRTGDEVLDNLDIYPELFHYNIIMVFLLTIGWRFLAFVALLVQSYKR